MTSTTQINRLYQLTHYTRNILGRIKAEAATIQQVAMNAAVAASHAGSSIRTFSEISKEIDISGKRILNLTELVTHEVDQFLELTLQALRSRSQLDLYNEALEKMNMSKNYVLVQGCIADLQHSIFQSLEFLRYRTNRAQSIIKTIDLYQHRIFSLATSIRIETIKLDPQQDQLTFSRLADDLEKCSLTSMVSELQQNLYLIHAETKASYVMMRKGQDEYATHQAV